MSRCVDCGSALTFNAQHGLWLPALRPDGSYSCGIRYEKLCDPGMPQTYQAPPPRDPMDLEWSRERKLVYPDMHRV